jgi:hypothetical protein
VAPTVAKLSVSLATEDVAWARKRAKQEGKTLSAILTEALASQRRAEAAKRLVRELGGLNDVTDAEREAVFAEWNLAEPRTTTRRSKSAAKAARKPIAKARSHKR